MAETKNFLSLTGLQHYDEKIKALIKSQDTEVTNKLMALIGAAEEGNKKTILARIKDLETAVGDISKLPGEVKELVAAIVGESKRAQAAEGTLGNRLNTIEGDGAGSIKKALADANAHTDELNKAMDSRVDALETAIGDGGSVAEKINTAIGGLDADITSAAVEAGKGIQVQVVETDGKVTGVNVTGNFDNKYDALGAAATVNSALETYKGTNNAAVAAAKKAGDDAQKDVDALKAKVGTVAEGKTVVGLINDAKQAAIDEASYDDTQIKADIVANTSAIATLNGNASTAGSVAKAVADAKNALEAKIKTNTDAIAVLNGDGEGSVSKQVADAVAGIVSGAPTAYDTLKEISDWISNHASDASAMNSQINTNKTDITNIKTELASFVAISEDDINALFTA